MLDLLYKILHSTHTVFQKGANAWAVLKYWNRKRLVQPQPPCPAHYLPPGGRSNPVPGGRVPHSSAAWGCPSPVLAAPGGQRRQLRPRSPGHPHPVQPGGKPPVAGPAAGSGHRPGSGGRAAGVSLPLGGSPVHPGCPGRGRGAAFAGRSPGAFELAHAISYLTSRVVWTTMRIHPTPGGCHP